jgi:hypothetical protein
LELNGVDVPGLAVCMEFNGVNEECVLYRMCSLNGVNVPGLAVCMELAEFIMTHTHTQHTHISDRGI